MKGNDTRTSDSLKEYNNNLKADLAHGLNYTKLLDIMIHTDDKQDLLDAVFQLIDYKLDTTFVHFPIQYSKADLYLLFMNRLLEEHSIASMVQMGTAEGGQLKQRLAPLNDADEFAFVDQETGADYVDQRFGQHLFNIDFQRKEIHFNGRALLDLFIVELGQSEDAKSIIGAVKLLINFAQFMHYDYGFTVHFGILDMVSKHSCAFQKQPLDRTILDRLFIIAAQEGYPLISFKETGAQLKLQDVDVNIADEGDAEHPKWGLQVVDSADNVSWFNLLLQYDFLRQWYLDHIDSLELK